MFGRPISLALTALLLGACHSPVQKSGGPPVLSAPHTAEVTPAPTRPATEPEVRREPEAVAPLIALEGGIVVDRATGEVRMPAYVAIEAGFLEQAVCARNTRDHESVLVVDLEPSQVHAALMLLGLEPGAPGTWSYEPIIGTDRVRVRRSPPSGDRVAVRVRHPDPAGRIREDPIADWIIGVRDGEAFPDVPWIFGGSRFERFGADDTEIYLADQSGSLVGLVTFGDEVLGLKAVRSDQVAVDNAEWEIRSDVIPTPGTRVELVMRRWPDEETEPESVHPE